MKHLPNILIVDDTNENLKFLEYIIQKTEVNLIQALSGYDAIEKTHGMELALAIIDVRMPIMDGFELAQRLNDERKVEKVPIIFLTASSFNEKDVITGYGLGAVDYIVKPVPGHVLLSKIKVFLDLFHQKQTIKSDAAQRVETANELIRVNLALNKSEEKYRSYIEHAPDGVIVTDEAGRFIEMNKAASLITGYSISELLSMSISNIISETSLTNDISKYVKSRKMLTETPEVLFTYKDGSNRWMSIESVKLSEKRFLSFIKDITYRKIIEEELKSSLVQLQQLTNYIEKAREDERTSISRELHDDLGQVLTAVKIHLQLIRQTVEEKDLIVKLDKVTGLTSEAIQSVKRITKQLRPEILDNLGLEAAIKWYLKEFSERTGIEIIPGIISDLSIPTDASLSIFRIVQESLTNISRHSKASRVYLSLSKNKANINLMISDNGIGITESETGSKKTFGIISMKERTASLGGTFDIYAEKGNGTVIKIIIPLKQSTKHENPDL
jgi:PAS domain S-box-containing protein